MALTPQLEALLQRNARENRDVFPAHAMAGIGHPPFVLAPNAFGGLVCTGGGPSQTFGTSPSLVTLWNRVFPDFASTKLHPEWMDVSLSGNLVISLSKGLYLLFLAMSGTVATGAAFSFELYLNGQPSGVVLEENLSNQSDEFSGSLNGVVNLPENGMAVSLYGSADQADRLFTAGFCELQLFRLR